MYHFPVTAGKHGKHGQHGIALLTLPGKVWRSVDPQELWYLIGIQADITGLSKWNVPEDENGWATRNGWGQQTEGMLKAAKVCQIYPGVFFNRDVANLANFEWKHVETKLATPLAGS